MKKIVLTGGGTAGHVIPNLALLPEMKEKFDKIYYVGSGKEIEKTLVEKENIPYFTVPAVKFQRNKPISLFKIPASLIKSVSQAVELLKDIEPSVVFSKGGYVSFPTVLASHKLGIPVVVHESDISLGLANKASLPICQKLITSYPVTPLYNKGIYIGQPIRKECFDGDKTKVDFERNGKQNLLVVGGSTGAKSLNDFIYKIKNDLDFNVIHLTGKGKSCEYIQTSHYKTIEFSQNIFDLYAWADVIVSRAGAGACFELAALKKRVVLIPLESKASRGDQVKNAEYWSKFDHMETLREKEFSLKDLLDKISKTNINKGNEYVFDKNTNRNIVELLYALSR